MQLGDMVCDHVPNVVMNGPEFSGCVAATIVAHHLHTLESLDKLAI
jgi:hypothetical protein